MPQQDPRRAAGPDRSGFKPSPVPRATEPEPAAPRRGLGGFLSASGNVAKAAGSLTRRVAADVADTAYTASKDIVDGARNRRSGQEIVSTVVNDWVDGARKVLLDEESQRVGEELRKAAKPVVGYLPRPVRAAASQVIDNAPTVNVTDFRRRLYERSQSLLNRSSTPDDAEEEHPALIDVLKEISPDEARVVRYLGTAGPQAVIDIAASNPMTRNRREMLHNYSLVAREAGCVRPAFGAIYLENLTRLGVTAIRPYRLRSVREYDLLMCQPEVLNIEKPRGRLIRLKTHAKGVELTEFGRLVLKDGLGAETTQPARVHGDR